MNAAAAPIPNSRIKIVPPTYDNARLLLLTSVIMAALSGIQLAISHGKDATFLATVLDVAVAAGSIAGIIFALNHMRSMMIPVEAPGRFKNLGLVMRAFRNQSIPDQDDIIVKKRDLWLFPLAIIPDECWVAMNRRVRGSYTKARCGADGQCWLP
jgi:hypothetical protein